MRKLFNRFRFMMKIKRFIPFLRDYYLSAEVPVKQKVIPLLLVVAYIFIPIDIIPDFLSVFGILDDLTLLTFLLQRMVRIAPPSIKEKYELI
ncbi:DUF1232 domain-containing protein [Bacillus salitolerans]|uniref:DUF1232 domain-containing protein n=1 Tax=Bacillus salitolerans TaxID=1437434 RepID=A0ABW4LSM7_9BACI